VITNFSSGFTFAIIFARNGLAKVTPREVYPISMNRKTGRWESGGHVPYSPRGYATEVTLQTELWRAQTYSCARLRLFGL